MREMKDSGVQWIGEIPKEWNTIHLRHIADIETGNMDTQNNDPDGAYPFYVRSPIVERSNDYTFDDIEAILMAGDGVGAGRVFHLVHGKYGCHQRVYRMNNFRYAKAEYLKYYLESIFPFIMDQGSAKSTVDSVRLPMLKSFNVVVPSLTEQNNIIAYLDRRCAAIDALIANQQQQIDKLKQYKQAVITEAVTRGLDPNVRMKDSGVEWIGEVPEHWKIIPSKHLFANCDERRHHDDEQMAATQKYGVISQKEYMERENCRIVLADKGLENWKHVEPNDFVISLRSFQGGLEYCEKAGCVTWHYIVLRAKRRINYRYYRWLFKSPLYIQA